MNVENRLNHLEIDEWQIREPELELNDLGHAESVFALANGYLGLRGSLDEGEPVVSAGTYIASFYERFPLPHAEPGYGYPEFGQAMVNVTDGKTIRLIVEDTPLEVRTGTLHSHERVLDLQAGTLTRDLDWSTPRGHRVRVKSTRLVSFEYRSVSAIRYEVTAVSHPVRIIVQSELIANEPTGRPDARDPRVSHLLEAPLRAVAQERGNTGAILVHRTKESDLTVAANMAHEVVSEGDPEIFVETRPDWARTTFVVELEPGQTVEVTKFVAHATSPTRSVPLLRSQVSAAISTARHVRWDGLLAAQRAYLDAFWADAEVEVLGNSKLTGMLRYALFQVLQAAARNEVAPIGAKALTGSGYSGHTFWDTEGFLAPVLAAVLPHACADVLRWRASIIDQARDRAAELGLRGAAFPWRTIDGTEASAYWPASTAAMHINADIVRAFELYRWVSGDNCLETDDGAIPVLIETARAWISLGHEDRHGRIHFDGLTGPDEYTAVINDNVFTNMMAGWNLHAAADRSEQHPELAAELGVDDAERSEWRRAADSIHIPYDDDLGVHPACAGFTRFDEWEWERFIGKHPIQAFAPYFEIYRHQVIKQADLVQAIWWCPERFTADEVARNLDYYERRTSRDSSLSATPQAIVCAQAGHLELALAYLYESAAVDLEDVQGNADHGLHMASLAGSWLALVAGLGGYRESPDHLELWPQLLLSLDGYRFRLLRHGVRVEVTVTPTEVALLATGEIAVQVYGEKFELAAGEPATRPLRRIEPLLPEPSQPPGRAPARLF